MLKRDIPWLGTDKLQLLHSAAKIPGESGQIGASFGFSTTFSFSSAESLHPLFNMHVSCRGHLGASGGTGTAPCFEAKTPIHHRFFFEGPRDRHLAMPCYD